MICVLDYGMGNLRSVTKALEKLGGRAQVSSSPEELREAEKLVLPGVGAFGDGVSELRSRKLFDPLREVLLEGRPFLGICLGMQLLFEESEESPSVQGLGIFRGKVQRFRNSELKIPHMGWNEMKIQKADVPLLKEIREGSYFYFVHSFYPVPQEESLVVATCEYGGEEFPAFVGKDRVWACQFHPEKSQEAGQQILRNFLAF